MISREGKDLALGKRISEVLKKANLDVDAVEVWSIPRPTGGNGLCVNFCMKLDLNFGASALPAISERIRLILAFLIRQSLLRAFTSLQFGFSIQKSGSDKLSRGGRFFFESPEVRRIEEDPNLLVARHLEDLVTTVDLHPRLSGGAEA